MPSDPHRPKLLLGLPAHTVALLILFFAALDGWATIQMLAAGHGTELNPLMAWLLGRSPALFLCLKLLLTALCVNWIVRRERHPYARVAAIVALAIYVPIVGLHIANPFALAGA